MKTAKEFIKDKGINFMSPDFSIHQIIPLMEEYASQYTTNKVEDLDNIESELADEKEQAIKRGGIIYADNYIEGMVDGIRKGLSLSTPQEKQPEREMSPKFTEADMRNLLSKFRNTQISFSKMVESINEKFYTLPKQITEGKEEAIVNTINSMCIESLSPEVLEQWDNVKKWLINNRKNLKNDL